MKPSRQPSKRGQSQRQRRSRPPEHPEQPSAEAIRDGSRTAEDRGAVNRAGDDTLGPTKAFPT